MVENDKASRDYIWLLLTIIHLLQRKYSIQVNRLYNTVIFSQLVHHTLGCELLKQFTLMLVLMPIFKRSGFLLTMIQYVIGVSMGLYKMSDKPNF